MRPDDPLYALLGGNPAFGEPAFRFPRARGALAAQQRDPVALPQSAARYRDDAAALKEQAATKQAEPVDLSQFEEYAQQRKAQGESSMLVALAAQLAGERFAPIGAAYLKKAVAANDPLKVGNNVITSDGQFLRDPFKPQEDQVKLLLARADRLEQMALQAQTAEERNQALREAAELRSQVARREREPARLAQGGTFADEDGTVYPATFDPNDGYYYRVDANNNRVRVPPNARPVTPSTGGALNAKQFGGLLEELNTEETAILRLDKYLSTIGDTNIGVKRLADQIAANARTLFGSGKLTPKELAAQVGAGNLQSLLGLMRETVVGPGVMTEYDAKRVIQALGGDFNALQNPQVVESLLRDIAADKRRRIDVLKQQRDYSARFFPGMGQPQIPSDAPPAPLAQPPVAQQGAPGSAPLTAAERREMEELRKRLGR